MSAEPEINRLQVALSETLGDFDIVYLPTYRRLELSLAADEPRRRRQKRPALQLNERSIHSGKVEFGLSDIRQQLQKLNNSISNKSNTGYRDLTARILNDLLESKLDEQLPMRNRKPQKDDLEIFFERLSDSRRMGPYPQVSIPNIERLYGESLDDSRSNFFLQYFMDQLTDVIDVTKDIEQSVDNFITTCNKYLLRTDFSTQRYGGLDASKKRGDAKKLALDRSTLIVSVESVPTGKKISLDALSSGEKQMVSLFAKMYLYPRDKIVLIDEPELSLSIDWQTQLLPDIIMSPNCAQLVAITHSPFVFDNDLEPYARSLDVIADYSRLADPEAPESFEFD